jgi:hypothetical protein
LADDTKERKSAEAQFKKEERATKGAKAMAEYKAEREAERAKTERFCDWPNKRRIGLLYGQRRRRSDLAQNQGRWDAVHGPQRRRIFGLRPIRLDAGRAK